MHTTSTDDDVHITTHVMHTTHTTSANDDAHNDNKNTAKVPSSSSAASTTPRIFNHTYESVHDRSCGILPAGKGFSNQTHGELPAGRENQGSVVVKDKNHAVVGDQVHVTSGSAVIGDRDRVHVTNGGQTSAFAWTWTE